MKLTYFLLIGLAGFFFSNCKKTDATNSSAIERVGLPTDLPPSDQSISFTLESTSQLNNKTVFTWKVVNLNPWSSNNPNGTKDLTNWLLVFKGDYVPNISGAFYSVKGVLTPLKSLDYAPVNGSCFTRSALNFDFGTKGGEPTYYVLVVEGYLKAGLSNAIVSTKDNNCFPITIPGVFTDVH
jgi:hypothetical protein